MPRKKALDPLDDPDPLEGLETSNRGPFLSRLRNDKEREYYKAVCKSMYERRNRDGTVPTVASVLRKLKSVIGQAPKPSTFNEHVRDQIWLTH